MRRSITNILIGISLGIFIITQSGLAGLAQAASTACDKTDFIRFFLGTDGVSTYAVTSSPATWQNASSLAKAQGGRLAVITGPALNSAIFGNLSSAFGTASVTDYPSKKAWIDLTDPNSIPDWSMPGQAPVIVPSRFSWADGTSTYNNWAAGQPDGYCTTAEMAVNPNHICYGENYAVINSDGTWSDEGDHGPTPLILPAVVEWPNTALDCVKPATPVSTPVVTPLPGAAQGELWCTSTSQTNLQQCLQTTDGQQLCPLQETLCNVNQEQPTCPAGFDGTPGTVNTTRTPSPMCQTAAHTTCPSTGAYVASPDLCYKDAYKGCPTGYTYSTANNRCEEPPQCAAGTIYNDATNKCESTSTYSASPVSGSYAAILSGAINFDTFVCLAVNDGGCAGGAYASSRSFSGNLILGAVWDNFAWNNCGSLTVNATGEGMNSTCGLGFLYVPNTQLPGLESHCLSRNPDTGICNISAWMAPSYGIYGGTYTCSYGGALSGTTCNTTSYTCPSGGTLSGTTCNVLNQINPTCPGGSFQDNGTSGDVCFTPYSPICNDPAFVVSAPGQPDLCQSAAVHDCPTGYAWNGDPVDMCEAVPACPIGTYQPQGNFCYMDQSCPLDQSICNGNSAPAVCPDGTTLNTTDNMCEADPTVACGTGYTWNAAIDKCTLAITCPDGGTYNATTNLCEKLVQSACPTGYTFDSTNNLCAMSASCPGGGLYNPATDRCESAFISTCSTGYTYDSTKSVCYAPVLCPSGGTFSIALGVCTLPYVPSCLAGFTYDSSTNRCEAAVHCPAGSTFDAASNECVASSTYAATLNYTCPSGGTLTGTNCVIGGSYVATPNYTCPSGGTLSGTSCITTSTYAATPNFSCPSGGTLSGTNCITSGSYAATPIYSCPSGGTLSGSTCNITSGYAATPTYACPSGGTLSGTTCSAYYTATAHPPNCDCYSGCDVFGNNGYPGGCSVSPDCDSYTWAPSCDGYPSFTCDSGGSLINDSNGIECIINYTASVASYSCPSGGSLSGSTCNTSSSYSATLSSYSCPSGGTLSGSTCNTSGSYAATLASYSCPSGGTLSGTTCTTTGSYPATLANYSCPSGGTLSGSTCNTGSTYAATLASTTCNAGDTLSGSTCTHTVLTSPTCTNGVFDSIAHLCWASYSQFCSPGSTYDSASNQCLQTATCQIGATLNTSTGRCEQVVSTTCSTSYFYDSTNSICYSAPVCASGVYSHGRCEISVTKDCGTYTLDSSGTICSQSATCPTDPAFALNSSITFSKPLNECVSTAQHACVAGTAYRGLPATKCQTNPTCSNGMTYNAQTGSCCPGAALSCHQIVGDTTEVAPGIIGQYCSPNSCQNNTSGWTTISDTPTGQNDKTNNGPTDANGNCLGQIYLFNGNDMRCRVYDRNGMVDSYAKLIAEIALAATGAGAALAGVLAASAGISTAVATAIVNTAITTAVNASIDAATGQFNAQSTLISLGISAVGQALPSLSSSLQSSVSGSGLANADAISSNIDLSPGSLQINPDFAPAVGTGEEFTSLGDSLQGSSTLLDGAIQQAGSPISSAFLNYFQQIQSIATQYSPAISQGMLGNYKETKCCYPDTLSGSCESSEIQEATEQHNGMCHIVGSYCSSRLLGVCMTEKQTSCCYQSLLARIMQEQGRPQLQSFSAGWGSPRNPSCRGFTPQEFQQLNFSIMDLSEWEASLNANMSQIAPLVSSFINSTSSGAAQSIQSSPAYKAAQ